MERGLGLNCCPTGLSLCMGFRRTSGQDSGAPKFTSFGKPRARETSSQPEPKGSGFRVSGLGGRLAVSESSFKNRV